LLAAEKLGVKIYYQLEEKIEIPDLILLNTNQSWSNADYLNYYCKNGYPEYIKMRAFMEKHGVKLRIVMGLSLGRSRQTTKDFRQGKMIFHEAADEHTFEICWKTVAMIRRANLNNDFMNASKFWAALVKLINNIYFNEKKWYDNSSKMVERFYARASTNDYYKMMLEIHNYRNDRKISLDYDEK
jgi:hypothetical protein